MIRTRDDAHSTEQNRCARPSETTVRAVGRLQAAQGFSSRDILTCFIAAPRSASARSFASMARHSSADVAFSRSLASAIISAWSWRSLRDWRSSIVLPPTRPDAQERPAALYLFFLRLSPRDGVCFAAGFARCRCGLPSSAC